MAIDVESVSVYAGYVLYQIDEDQKRVSSKKLWPSDQFIFQTLRRKATIEKKLEQMEQQDDQDELPQNFAQETQEQQITTGDSDV